MFGLHPDAWSAVAAWMTLVVLGTTAAFAYIQVRDARRLREEEARPVVVVDIDADKQPHMIYLSYENFGRTTAHDVRVVYDPPLTATVAAGEYVHFFSNTFPTLAPGKQVGAILDPIRDRLNSDLPEQYRAIATYTDANGRVYESPYLLDLSVLKGRLTSTQKDLGDVVDVLGEVAQTLQNFGSTFGDVTDTMLPYGKGAEE